METRIDAQFNESVMTLNASLGKEPEPLDADFGQTTLVHGETPYIGENGNWWIGKTDTGTKAQGPQGATGADGANGTNGKDGKTPVKGIDYFTDSDKAEIANAVLAMIPIYDGEVIAE